MAVAKGQIQQIISENNIFNVADVYSLLKESFKDILQELMEAELDVSLDYEKIKKEIWHQQQTKWSFSKNSQESVWGIPGERTKGSEWRI